MRVREMIPVSLRLQILRSLWPIRTARLHAEAERGMRFGQRIALRPETANGQPANGQPASAQSNRLEQFFDRHLAGPGIEKWRHYFEIYDRHFAKFVGREVSVVEVGVSSGGSLQMWLDYFGAGCHVYGIDIDPACKVHETESIKIYTGDQSDPRFWTWFLREVPRIDILIDDGGHRVRQQATTLEFVLSQIQPGGVYLCEDILGTDHAFHGYLSGFARNLHSWDDVWATDFQRIVGGIHMYPFVTVIDRPEVDLPKLPADRNGTKWRL